MRKRFLNKVMAVGLSAGLFLTGSMPVLAAGGGAEETQNLGINDSTGVSEVVYDTAGDQHFTVIIPKKIVLGSDKTAEYGVTVKGDVAQGSRVKVEPQDDVDAREGVNFVMEATGMGGSKNVDVTQNDLYWNYAEIVANDYEGTEKSGTVNGSELTFGIWQGDLTFLINFEDEYGDAGETEDYSGIEDWEYELNESGKTVTLKKYIGESLDVAVHSKYDVNGTTYKAQLPNVVEYTLFNSYNIKSKIQHITFDNDFDTSNVTSMKSMFAGCNSLQSLDVSMFNTSNVTNMNAMFVGCNLLQSLDISMFNTSNVTDMGSMFSCGSLQSLDVSMFDTSNVTNMSAMFDNCHSLQSLDVSMFDTSNVTNMSSMFMFCSSLQSINISNFNTSNVTDMSGMFSNCDSLQSLDLSSFDTSNVTDMSGMFSNCDSLQSLDLSKFDTSNVTNMINMFSAFPLQSLDLSSFNTSNVIYMNGMFVNSSSLQSLDLSSFDIVNVTEMIDMFKECINLQSIKVSSKWVTEQADTKNMFENCGTDHVTYVE